MKKLRLIFLIVFCFVQSTVFSETFETVFIKKQIGKPFLISLEANFSTGFQWQIKSIKPNTLLSSKGSYYLKPKSELIGAGGIQVFSFMPKKKGTAKITFVYVRPWEKNHPLPM